jgi:hypothetical protein
MFYAQEKSAEIFYNCHTHDFFLGEHFFWHCGMFMCFAPSFVNQCKNSFIIGFYVDKQASMVKNNYVIHNKEFFATIEPSLVTWIPPRYLN